MQYTLYTGQHLKYSIHAVHSKQGLALKIFFTCSTQYTRVSIENILYMQYTVHTGQHKNILYIQYTVNSIRFSPHIHSFCQFSNEGGQAIIPCTASELHFIYLRQCASPQGFRTSFYLFTTVRVPIGLQKLPQIVFWV